MKNKLVYIVLIILSAVFYADRIRASKIYENGDKVENCLFEANCDHYNVKFLEDF